MRSLAMTNMSSIYYNQYKQIKNSTNFISPFVEFFIWLNHLCLVEPFMVWGKEGERKDL